jgi:hypothetical protein
MASCDASDEGSSTGGECPHEDQVVLDASALPHGAQCISNEDCQYGQCVTSELVSGFDFKFCTKQCACGENSQCSQDGAGFTCLRYGPSYPDEPYTAFCAPTCATAADCTSLGPYTACTNIDGAGIQDVCVVK